MNFDSLYLTEALIMLLFPLGLCFSKGVSLQQYSSASVTDEHSLAKSWALIPMLWVDPLRAFVGTMLLINGLALPLAAVAPAMVDQQRLIYTLGTLVVALLVEMFAVRQPEDDAILFTPVGFSVGMIFALIPSPMVAGLTVVVAVASVAAFRSWYAFFLGAIVALGCTGLLLIPEAKLMLASVCALLMVPVVVCIVSRREFVIPIRRRLS